MTIRRLLVANRGEIARRIFRTASAMGIETVAVYSDGDAEAPFVYDADLAMALNGRSAAASYLDIDKILAAASRSGADAVHPGYGFLSERADFARAVVSAGLTWVGPPPGAIETLGDKVAAKALMAAAGVPVLPWVELGADSAHRGRGDGERGDGERGDGERGDGERGDGERGDGGTGDGERADDGLGDGEVGGLAYPLMVKAAAGGGGRGMRIVHHHAGLAEAVAAARREAGAAFGDRRVFVERYLSSARHVEIQVLMDGQGNSVHLFERDCSVQRRHQKVIEEAPGPAVSVELRARMGSAALEGVRAVDYRGAGTVEFLVEPDGSFWFLEVNTRLQVEHPVTEAITGVDLVRQQLLVAAGLPLDVAQAELSIAGHAVEARLYAEDPAAGFLPSTGTVVAWAPAVHPSVRIDSGIAPGSVIGVEFDPMLAKIIAHAPTRTEAVLRLALALQRLVVRGPATNRDFLVAALRHPQFLAAKATTAFIETSGVETTREPEPGELELAAVAVALTAQVARRIEGSVAGSLPTGWRNTPMPFEHVALSHGDHAVGVDYRAQRDGGFTYRVAGQAGTAVIRQFRHHPAAVTGTEVARSGPDGVLAGRLDLEVDGVRSVLEVARAGPRWWVQGTAGDLLLMEGARFPGRQSEEVTGGLRAPMTGRVAAIEVVVGQEVALGALLVVVEAMKMEHRVVATGAGTVVEVRVEVGAQVAGGDLLVVIADPSATGDPAGARPAGGTGGSGSGR